MAGAHGTLVVPAVPGSEDDGALALGKGTVDLGHVLELPGCSGEV